MELSHFRVATWGKLRQTAQNVCDEKYIKSFDKATPWEIIFSYKHQIKMAAGHANCDR